MFCPWEKRRGAKRGNLARRTAGVHPGRRLWRLSCRRCLSCNTSTTVKHRRAMTAKGTLACSAGLGSPASPRPPAPGPFAALAGWSPCPAFAPPSVSRPSRRPRPSVRPSAAVLLEDERRRTVLRPRRALGCPSPGGRVRSRWIGGPAATHRRTDRGGCGGPSLPDRGTMSIGRSPRLRERLRERHFGHFAAFFLEPGASRGGRGRRGPPSPSAPQGGPSRETR